jgi:hypothetical protein
MERAQRIHHHDGDSSGDAKYQLTCGSLTTLSAGNVMSSRWKVAIMPKT